MSTFSRSAAYPASESQARSPYLARVCRHFRLGLGIAVTLPTEPPPPAGTKISEPFGAAAGSGGRPAARRADFPLNLFTPGLPAPRSCILEGPRADSIGRAASELFSAEVFFMGIRIANAPISWGVDVVEWGPRPAPARFLDEVAAAGYEGTELGPYGYLPTNPTVLRAELAERSLSMVSAFVGLPLKTGDADLNELNNVAALLAAAGARAVIVADTMWPERVAVAGRVPETGIAMDEQEWGRAATTVRAACECARRNGLRPVFHNHAGSYIETPDELLRISEMSGADICFDSGHYAYGGGDPSEAVKKFGDRIQHLHWKDVHPERLAEVRRDQLNFIDGVTHGVFCPLGEGMVDFPSLTADLDAAGYDGWATVEQDVDTKDETVRPLEYAKASREYLHRLMGSRERLSAG